MPLTSPYNFVPINTRIYYPSWGNLVSMDVPFEDGEDGYIEVILRNVSPLFTRNGAPLEREKETESSYVIDANGDKRYFIPGTTIKGMLRGTLEMMAFGKIKEKEHYTNRWFGYRDVAQKTAESRAYVERARQGKPGWLNKEGDKYYFTPCIGTLEKISVWELKEIYPRYYANKSIWKTNCSLSGGKEPSYPEYQDESGKRYRIVCTGKMQRKKNELLFPSQTSEKRILLSEDTVNAFLTVYENTPDFSKFRAVLERRGTVPVFYLDSKNGSMPVIGLSKMFRIPYKHSLTDMIRYDQQPDDKCLDLCEVLFGTVHGIEDMQSFKGRIQIGHAFAARQVAADQLLKVSGVLGQPKASYYPLYVKQDTNPYKTYDTGTRLSGRKLYRIHKGASTTDLPRGNENANVKSFFYALPAGNQFVLRINVHNLKKVEIGALLSALTLNDAEGAYHNLGLAKSYGYGKIHIDEIKLHHLSFTAQEYESAFEQEMDAFVSEQIKSGLKWRETEQVVQLTNILREHDDDVVKLMPLGDSKTEGTYGYYKDKRNFKDTVIDRLTEPRNKV